MPRRFTQLAVQPIPANPAPITAPRRPLITMAPKAKARAVTEGRAEILSPGTAKMVKTMTTSGDRSGLKADPLGPRTILHVDMDAFFAAVEVLRDPSLRGKPVIVGGDGRRGVVAACTYEARAYGIHSAMPSMRARRLCPHATFIGGSYSRYTEASAQLHEILNEITPHVEGISIDEAFLDVTGAGRLFGTGEEIAHELRRRVGERLQLDCSVGVAPVKMIAKLASQAAKPTTQLVRGRPVVTPGPGVVVVGPGEELDFLWPKPIRALWGVGPSTGKRLADLGVATVGDLARLPLDLLVERLGAASGRHLHDLSSGRDARPVQPERGVKSVGHEQTYADDIVDPQRLATEVVRLSDAVAARLAEGGLAGRTVTLKVRFADFRTITRSTTEPEPLAAGATIARMAKQLLSAVDPGSGVRLLGVSLSNLVEGTQLSFEDQSKEAGVSPAIDEVRRRFGASAIGPAALVRDGKVGTLRRGQQQWGPGAEGPAEKSDGKVGAVEDRNKEPGA